MPTRTPKEIETQVVQLYQENYGTTELSEMFNLHRSTIQRILKSYNVPLRKTTTTYKYNIHFFDTYTPESCYWAGFIAADGCLRADRACLTIKLHIKDKEHLQKFIDCINFTGNIIIDSPDAYDPQKQYCRVEICGNWYYEPLLKNFNITPRKTFTLEPPTQMPKELLNHYLRGYFDGDGSISNEQQNTCHFTITSGSINILNFWRDYLYDQGIRIRKLKDNQEKPPIMNNVQINYQSSNAVRVCNILYEDSTQQLRLDRKYNLYLYWKEKMKWIEPVQEIE